MCGICGMIGAPDRELLANQMAALRHRGPDDEGFYLDPCAALGHTRLSIIDVAGGHQPISNEDDSLWIVFNGEIYNYLDLRRELLSKGHRFKTKSDTETILHLYEEMGERCVTKLVGMFAFAIWNRAERKLYIARDRLGIKPLFYSFTPKRFIFASEMKALLLDPDVGREIDLEALDRYLTFMYVPAPATILRTVRKLPPGHYGVLKERRLDITQYWDLPPLDSDPLSEKEEEARERLLVLLRQAVKRRLMSEVPLGAYLSGGLDSSLVAAMMCRESATRVNTFSVGFHERGFDERPYARRVASFLGTVHRELVARHEAFELLPKMIWHLDEPVADSAIIPTYLMAELTKQHVTVVLTGEGADELFAGYSHYKLFAAGHAMRRLIPHFLPECVQELAGSWITAERLAYYLSHLRDPAAAYLALKAVFSEDEKKALYAGELRGAAISFEPPAEMIARYLRRATSADYLSRLLRLDVKMWLADDLLVKVDRMTMAHAVEARVPYLDHELVEEVFRLPSWIKLRGFTDKYILRLIGKDFLPPEIVRRRKTGFAVPVSRWAHGALREFVHDMLSPESIQRRGFFNPAFVQKLLSRQPFCEFRRRQFWTLLVFELWCRQFIEV